jgi:hypothetical protein|tara:strand:+ start:1288 stop:1548 length:261 start_codon:yes stop_codon:yes gene_type:complete
MTKIRAIKETERFFYFQSGNWEGFISADSKESALDELVKEIKNQPQLEIGKVLICLDASRAATDLTLEESLFFIPVEEVLGRFDYD